MCPSERDQVDLVVHCSSQSVVTVERSAEEEKVFALRSITVKKMCENVQPEEEVQVASKLKVVRTMRADDSAWIVR